MDIVTALAVLSPFPVDMQETTLTYRGSFHPRMLAVAAKNDDDLADILQHASTRDPEMGIRIALSLEKEALAWTLLDALPVQHNVSSSLDMRMRRWVAHNLDQRQISHTELSTLILVKQPLLKNRAATRAMNSVQEMLSSLHWPLWHGPLLISMDTEASETRIIKRALMPEIILHDPQTDEVALSQAICALALQRYERGQHHLPLWLRQGLLAVVRHKCEGSGPSPRRMHSLRQTKGLAQLRQLFHARQEQDLDHALAKAVVAPLVHTRQKHRLANLCELLINNMDSANAIKIAYGRDLQSLIDEP